MTTRYYYGLVNVHLRHEFLHQKHYMKGVVEGRCRKTLSNCGVEGRTLNRRVAANPKADRAVMNLNSPVTECGGRKVLDS